MSFDEASMPVWDEKHLRAATTAAGVALWSWNVDTDAITMDERAYDLWEVSKDERQITFEILSRNIHPADLERVRSAFAATRAVVGAYEIDFRILSGSDIRWISARGQGDDAESPTDSCSAFSSTSRNASRPKRPANCSRAR
jgi:PAS domain-containing protein